MFFINRLRTPLTGASLLSDSLALTEGEVMAPAVVDRASTQIEPSSVARVVREKSPASPSPTSRRILAARTILSPVMPVESDHSSTASVKDQTPRYIPRAGPYRSPIRSKLRAVLMKQAAGEREAYFQRGASLIRMGERERSWGGSSSSSSSSFDSFGLTFW